MKLSDAGRYSTRFVVLASLLTLPFLRMLLRDGYGLVHIEVALAIALIAGAAALLAALARTSFLFRALLVVLSVLLSVNVLQMDFMPDVRLRWLLPGTAILVAGAILLLREHFYGLLLIFLFGSFAVDAGKAGLQSVISPAATAASAKRELHHVVHLVFDEMVGLGTAPPECAGCTDAVARLRQLFDRGKFQVYPYAFSNYRSTRDSLPSILSGRLLKRVGEFVSAADKRPVLRENRYFEYYLRKNYAVRTYDSDYLLYSAPEYPSVQGSTYRTNNLKALHAIRLGWLARMRQLFVIYLQSDRFWWGALTRLLPPKYLPSRLQVGPLALKDVWPDRIVGDFRAATKNSLFFVHLMTPHGPYVYRRDGSVRDPSDWNSQRHDFTDDNSAEYWHHWNLYGEQTHFVATQLEEFLEKLRLTELYDSTTIVIHGDHGPRLRLLKASERQHRKQLSEMPGRCPPVSRYDYVGQPDPRDLLNRFATLLAIKLPDAVSPRVVTEPGSILYFLQRTFRYGGLWDGPNEINSAYLFDPDGSPRRIEMLPAFRIVSGSDESKRNGG